MFVNLVFSRFDTFYLNGGEWIRTGLLESIKPTKHKVNEHLSEWIRTGLLESIKPTKHKANEHLSGGEFHSPSLRCSLTLCLVGLMLSNNPVRIHSPPLRCSLTRTSQWWWMNPNWVVRKYQTTKHKVNEHLSGGEWIRTGLLESIKPTKYKVKFIHWDVRWPCV
jgi:hypothetical protein